MSVRPCFSQWDTWLLIYKAIRSNLVVASKIAIPVLFNDVENPVYIDRESSTVLFSFFQLLKTVDNLALCG